jgi:photosystem II stability/assembly factor-like uncharacterized protein
VGSLAIVGGGDISPSVVGWIHVSRDAGQTWSPSQTFPYPIRDVSCFNSTVCIATGGNFFTGVGGVYVSRDAGASWKLDLNAEVELSGLSVVGKTVFAAGSSGGHGGRIYRKSF